MSDTTDAEILAIVARLRAEAGEHQGIADELRGRSDQLEAFVMERGLRTGHHKGTLGTVDAQPQNRGSRVSAARTKHAHPFSRVLHARGSSPPQWARAQRKPTVDVEVVKSWLKKPGHGGRPIPRYWVDRIAAEFPGEGLDLAASWPNGIR